jgi:GTP-binding protein HflX
VTDGPPSLAEARQRELVQLCESAGLTVADRLVQRRPRPDPRFLVGRGKLEEIILRALQMDAEMLVFDPDLTPAQVRAIAELTELKVVDRTQVILDIFAQRAQSRDGKLQVELAQLRYLLPRLSLRDSGLSRLTGGIGGRGPGETKLEIDRRRARDRIRKLDKQIGSLSRRRGLRRRQRQRSGLPVVSIVGYTNAGKSTLLNVLTESEVLVEDKLFATLDPVTRRLRFPRDREVVITDTVGFIRDLPPDLVRAFRATLEELLDADLLLHVADASDPEIEAQVAAVRRILSELELDAVSRLLVLNKTDRLDPGTADEMARSLQGVPISALEPSTLPRLLEQIEARLWQNDRVRRSAN